jgi:hypothetical protein
MPYESPFSIYSGYSGSCLFMCVILLLVGEDSLVVLKVISYLENDSALFDVVYLKRKKCLEL